MKRLPRRFWTEVALGIVSASVLAVTAAWPNWIEEITGIDPDGRSGSLEWAVVAVLVVCAVVAPLMARRELQASRRARRHPGTLRRQ
jgi:hypothetical protein